MRRLQDLHIWRTVRLASGVLDPTRNMSSPDVQSPQTHRVGTIGDHIFVFFRDVVPLTCAVENMCSLFSGCLKVHAVDAQMGGMRRTIECVSITDDDEHAYCGTRTGDILKFKIDRDDIRVRS